MWVQQKEYKVVGTVLRAARQAAGLNQETVADRLRKPQSFVSSYERGQRRIDVLEFLTITGSLGADPMSLFSEIVNRTSGNKPRASKRR